MNLLEKLDQEGISTGMLVDSTAATFLRALPAPPALTVPSTVTVASSAGIACCPRFDLHGPCNNLSGRVPWLRAGHP